MISNEKLIERINSKWIQVGKKANLILQLMENENLPCTFDEAMEIGMKVKFNEMDFNVFFNNYKMIMSR